MYLFTYQYQSISPPGKCTFACLSTIRRITQTIPQSQTGGLSWPLKVSSSTGGVLLQLSSPYRPSFHQEALVNITTVNKVYCGQLSQGVSLGSGDDAPRNQSNSPGSQAPDPDCAGGTGGDDRWVYKRTQTLLLVGGERAPWR